MASTIETRLSTAKTVLSTAASLAATYMVARSAAEQFLPHEVHQYFFSGLRTFFKRFSSEMTIMVEEFDGLISNEIYVSAEAYLGTKITPSTQRLKVSKREKDKKFIVNMERNEEVVDVFNGVKIKWVLICQKVETRNFYNPRDLNSTFRSELRYFELCFKKKFKDMIMESYLPYIVKEGKSLKQENKTLKIFTVDNQHMYGNLNDLWKSVNLDHPATFDTVALDLELKNMILEDLERFVKRRDYYRKVGKAWKRGYLLYGPPGTGKSSLIAAIANYLNFDIYDLELTDLRSNSELRRLLVGTANRSILVVEDIDCTIELQDRMAMVATENQMGYSAKEQVTLSGLLNFIDGLWSSCGDERIIIFTTNHKEKLDSALLRPGRMDMHIHMSYCTPYGFEVLASNYIGIKHHKLFRNIKDAISETNVTPADIAEQLMRNEDVDTVLKDLIKFLKAKKIENEVAMAKENRKETSSLDEDEVKKNGEDKGNNNDNDENKISG